MTPRRLGCALFLAALGLHAGYVYDVRTNPGHGVSDFHCVRGGPYGDAAIWHEVGYELASGWGWKTWPGRRPLYGWCLGLLYTVVGIDWSYSAALALNVLLTAASVALIFAALQPIYGLLAAIAVAASVALSEQALLCSSVTLSEPLGLALLAGHVWLLVVGSRERRLGLLAASGVLLALSNAARTLTLLALPLYIVALAWNLWRAGAARRKALLAAAVLGLSTTATIVAFMTQNYVRLGIFALSDNSAWDLYAVSAPEYGQWSPEVQAKINRDLKIWQTKDLYDYQMREAKRNIRQHPRLFVTRVAGHLRNAAQTLLTLDVSWMVAFLAVAALLWRGDGQRSALRRWGGTLLMAAVAVAAIYSEPARRILLAAGVLLALCGRPRPEARYVACLFLGTLLAVGMFGSSMQRLLVMFQWSYLALALGCVGQLLLWGKGQPTETPSAANGAWRWAQIPAWALESAAVLLIIGAAVVVRQNTVARRPQVPAAELQGVAVRVAEAAMSRSPDLFTSQELSAARPGAALPLELVDEVYPDRHGTLVALCGQLQPYAYYFTHRTPAQHASTTAFQPRGYDRTVWRLAARDADGLVSPADVLLPGDARPQTGRYVCVLGRIHALGASPALVEAIAWCPWTGDTVDVDVRSLHVVDGDAQHRRVLRAFVAPEP